MFGDGPGVTAAAPCICGSAELDNLVEGNSISKPFEKPTMLKDAERWEEKKEKEKQYVNKFFSSKMLLFFL